MADELSGSDSDYGLQEDMEALRRACSFAGGDYGPSAAPAGRFSDSSSSESDDGDLELYRNIQQKFAAGNNAEEPLNLKPICALPPVSLSDSDDDINDDFEILRAIQRRFSDYNNDDLNDCRDNGSQKTQVGASTIDSEKETSNNLFSSTNIAEEFPDIVDATATRNISEPSSDIVHDNQYSDLFDSHMSCLDDLASSPVRDSGFPKSAQAFLDAIKKNRSCQKYIRNKLMQIESRIEENVKLRNKIKALKGFQFCCRRRTGLELSQKKDARLQLIQVPKLRANTKAKEKNVHVMYYGPPENSHVSNYKMVLQKFSDLMNRDKWTDEEDINLMKGIKQQFQDMLLQKTYQNEELLRQKPTDQLSDAGDSNNFDSMIALISDHDITDENLREFLPRVNWEQLASMYTKGRSGAECETRWLNYIDPLINKNSWTKSEEKKLLYIIQQKGVSNWIDIAASLGTNRTPFQCLAHYQRSLNASILKREWTEDEDDRLRAAVATYGESNWQCVASALEGRTGTQCSNRWLKSLHPGKERKGKWFPNEDKRLKVAVMLFGAKNWRNVAQYVPGRDQVQCRERWKNCLDPFLKMDEWSEEEDQRLIKAFEEHGPSWNKIASCVSRRTDNQCLRRWKTLFPHKVPRLQEARRIRKIALMSNFVDREARRPALGPSDFVQLQLLDSVSETDKMASLGKGKRKSSYVAKLRSAKHKRDAETDGVLRLTNGNRRCSNAAKSSRRDLVTSSVHEKRLVVTNVDKLPADDAHAARKNPRRSKRLKSGGAENSEAITASRHAATEIEELRVIPSSCVNECVDITNKKARNLRTTENRKALKQSSKEIELTEKVNEDSIQAVSDDINVNKKSDALEPCLSDHSDLSMLGDSLPSPVRSPGRMLMHSDVHEPFVGDNNDEIPLRCSTPDILDNLNSRVSIVCRKDMSKRSRPRSKTSDQIQNVDYEDDMTLASFINQLKTSQSAVSSSLKLSKLLPRKRGTINNSQSRALSSSDFLIGAQQGSKRLKTQSLHSRQMSKSETGDGPRLKKNKNKKL